VPASDPGHLLPWDTAFWGVRIGRVEKTTLTPERARAVDEWARANEIACVYFLASSADPPTAFAAAEAGWRLVDIRVELVHGLDESEKNALLPASEDDLPELRAIARVSHRDTRFYADPRFADDRCDDLYGLWLERSLEGWAEVVLVAGRVDGYVTCHVDDRGRGSIGLIAVDERARGRGVGQDLVRGAVGWFSERGLRDAAVVTQGRNVAAQRTFQRCGFRTAAVDLWFHKWYSA
jgi:dTDP-4-amino-4,6-dideoxy-D-galactose acyltransferase